MKSTGGYMGAALKLEEQHESTEKAHVKSGISYYDNEVFPSLEEGKTHFNWYAFFFGFYWYPSKGLMTEFAKLYLPLAVAAGLAEAAPRFAFAYLVSSIAIAVTSGKMASKAFLNKCKTSTKPHDDNILKGVGGVLLWIVVSAVSAGFFEGFIQGFKQGFSNARSSGQEVSQTTNSGDEIDYMDLYVDFNSYIGKSVTVNGASISIGDLIYFYQEFGSTSFMELNIRNLDRESRKQILSNCGESYCSIQVTGRAYVNQIGMKGIIADSVN